MTTSFDDVSPIAASPIFCCLHAIFKNPSHPLQASCIMYSCRDMNSWPPSISAKGGLITTSVRWRLGIVSLFVLRAMFFLLISVHKRSLSHPPALHVLL